MDFRNCRTCGNFEKTDVGFGQDTSHIRHAYGAPPSESYGSAPPPDSGYGRRAARGSRKLYLKLTAETRQEALRILAETPGSICVMLYMADEKKTYQAPREYWVDEGYDFGALANLLGADNIVLKG